MKRTKILLLLLTLLVASALVLAACGGGATEEPAPEEPEVEEPAAEEEDTGAGIVAEEATSTPAVMEEGSEYNEAPMLAEMVAAGELPPVDERLPEAEDIMVVAPVDGVGEYGGTWHNGTWGQDMGNISMINYDPPIPWNSSYSGYEPGLLKSWEMSEDGLTMTWNWRKGLKWSDGVEFIPAVDMAYWWELAINEDFTVISLPWWFMIPMVAWLKLHTQMTIPWSSNGKNRTMLHLS
jgi:ABC-type transport system substrate-binding protein